MLCTYPFVGNIFLANEKKNGFDYVPRKKPNTSLKFEIPSPDISNTRNTGQDRWFVRGKTIKPKPATTHAFQRVEDD